MDKSVRDKLLLYHLTAATNLPRILREGLRSRQDLESHGDAFADHADPEIIRLRAPHGLAGFVPFHFFSRNPFDYAAVRRAAGVPFVLISVRRTYAAGHAWKVVPRHPLSDYDPPEVLEWSAGLQQVDWSQMDRPARDYDNDRECRLACMAEALSPTAVPASAFQSLFVATGDTERQVQVALRDVGLSCYVNVKPSMFPRGTK